MECVSICPTVPPSPAMVVSSITNINDLDHEFNKLVEDRTQIQYRQVALEILGQYRDCCVVGSEPTGYTAHMPFHISTGQAEPISQRPYRIPVAHQADVEEQLQSLQKEGIIKLSKSPWASPVVVVKKKNGGLRLCVDYRKLNAVTVGDSFPLPSIEELLIKVRNSKFFSCLDLKSGYHQIALDSESREKTAFCINDKLYEFTRLPFGGKNAPSHFSRTMTSILSNLIGSCLLVYMDDLIILGSTLEEHIHNLMQTLETLRRYNIKINLSKCQFFKSNVEFLGHIVSPEGIRPVHSKVEAIKNYSRPRNPKEVSSFLGLASYYRKFIPNFATISRPLDALRRTSDFNWSRESEKAFQDLKAALISDRLLLYPRFDRPFIITCDASSKALGGVVAQLVERNQERPISYCSRALKGAELNYSALDREALAIKFTLERHKYILIGHPVVVKTDHMPLTQLFKQPNLGARQARWLNQISEYDVREVQYIKGKKNYVADALSRSITIMSAVTRSQISKGEKEVSATNVAGKSKGVKENPETRPISEDAYTHNCKVTTSADDHFKEVPTSKHNKVRPEAGTSADAFDHHCKVTTSANECYTEVTTSKHNKVRPEAETSEDAYMHSDNEHAKVVLESDNKNNNEVEWCCGKLVEDQKRDPLWSQVRAWIQNPTLGFPKEIKMPRENFILENEVLYLIMPTTSTRDSRVRTVIPRTFVEKAMYLTHASSIAGHLGVDKTLRRAQNNFYWKGMKAEIKEYVSSCLMCQKFKGHTHRIPPARSWPISTEKFQRVHMDLVGPLPISPCGKRFIIVISDSLTRYIFTRALPNKSAEIVAQAFREFINLYGCPIQIVTDNGKEFVNAVLSNLTKHYKVEHTPIKAYRPSANGLVESKNKVVISILKFLIADEVHTWPDALSTATFALNSAYNRAVGDTPYFLVYAQDPRVPYDTFFNPNPPPCYDIESYRTYVCNQNRKIFRYVRHMLEKAGKEYQEDYDRRFKVTEPSINIGDRVYIRRITPKKHKLESKYYGPFRVLELKRDAVSVRNLYNSKISMVHLSQVKLCKERDLRDNKTIQSLEIGIYPEEDPDNE